MTDGSHYDDINDPFWEPNSATVRLSGDGSAFTTAAERIVEQTDEAAHLAAYRAGVGRTPEPSPERTERLEALKAVFSAPGPTAWIVNVPSPFPSERRDRNYGPFTEVEARAFAEGLEPTWRAGVRPVFAPDQVRSP